MPCSCAQEGSSQFHRKLRSLVASARKAGSADHTSAAATLRAAAAALPQAALYGWSRASNGLVTGQPALRASYRPTFCVRLNTSLSVQRNVRTLYVPRQRSIGR